MWARISKWRQKARYQRQQRQIQACGLYVVDQYGLALPTIRTAVTFPEGPLLEQIKACLSDAEALGASVVVALDYAAAKRDTSISKPYAQVQANFLDGMDRYRQSIGVGKRRFESQIELMGITRKDGEISCQMRCRTHGRFAFGGPESRTGSGSVRATASHVEIGEMIQSVYRNFATSP